VVLANRFLAGGMGYKKNTVLLLNKIQVLQHESMKKTRFLPVQAGQKLSMAFMIFAISVPGTFISDPESDEFFQKMLFTMFSAF
jgi:hypothetical protein